MKLLRTMFFLAVLALVPALAACAPSNTIIVDGNTGNPPAAAPATSGAPLPAPGRVAPEISLTSLQGQTVTLSSLRGHPVLVNFFATWCGPCRSEMDYLESVYNDADFQKAGFKLLEVNIQEDANTVQSFLADNNLTMPVLLDTEAIAAEAYNVNGIPASFFIDSNGIIQKIKVGAYPNQDALDRDVQSLINSK